MKEIIERLSRERQAHIDRMVELGVFIKAPRSASGYMFNVQPLNRLLAGGIYQNRWRMDAQYEEIDKRIRKLEAA